MHVPQKMSDLFKENKSTKSSLNLNINRHEFVKQPLAKQTNCFHCKNLIGPGQVSSLGFGLSSSKQKVYVCKLCDNAIHESCLEMGIDRCKRRPSSDTPPLHKFRETTLKTTECCGNCGKLLRNPSKIRLECESKF